MSTSKIKYLGNLRCEAIHTKSGKIIISDAPIDNQGKGEAFSPTDLMSTSLGQCMATIMGIAGQKHEINIDGMELEITKVMGTEPRRVVEIKVDFTMPKGNYSDREKAILENAALTCPVAKSLHPDLKQTVLFNYF